MHYKIVEQFHWVSAEADPCRMDESQHFSIQIKVLWNCFASKEEIVNETLA